MFDAWTSSFLGVSHTEAAAVKQNLAGDPGLQEFLADVLRSPSPSDPVTGYLASKPPGVLDSASSLAAFAETDFTAGAGIDMQPNFYKSLEIPVSTATTSSGLHSSSAQPQTADGGTHQPYRPAKWTPSLTVAQKAGAANTKLTWRKTSESNRASQQRWRQKQKDKQSNMSQQLEELSAELEKLRTENQALRTRSSTVEKSLEVRQQALDMLKTMQTASAGEMKEEWALALRAEHDPLPTAFLPNGGALSADQDLQARMKAAYNKTVDAVATILLTMPDEDNPTPEEEARLDAAVCSMEKPKCVLMHMAPRTFDKFLLASYSSSCPTEQQALHKAEQALASIRLTREQEDQILLLRQGLIHTMQEVFGARRGMLAALKSAQQAAETHGQARSPAEPSRPVSSTTLGLGAMAEPYVPSDEGTSVCGQVGEWVQRFRRNLWDEHQALTVFVSTLVKGVLRPIQRAKLLMQAYPQPPDTLRLASLVARQREGKV